MNRQRVVVLRGGPSEEYAVSLKSGENVLRSLRKQDYTSKDVVITRAGEWLDNGVAKRPEQILTDTDVVFLALHGAYGENGEVQRILERYQVPFTGSRAFPSAVAFNKALTKTSLERIGILSPRHHTVRRSDDSDLTNEVQLIVETFGPEYIIKPVASGSSIGVQFVRHGDDLATALHTALSSYDEVLVEEYIRGREATVGVLEEYRNEQIYVFPAVEIIPPQGADFFDAQVKYNGKTREICPGNFSYNERTKVSEIARAVHENLGLSQYSRSDFIIRDGQVYFLEVNTLPGLTTESLYPKAAESVGLQFDELVARLINTATT